MKKIFYTILASLAIVACSEELQPAFTNDANCETVTVDFSVSRPGDGAQTKAMALNPDIQNLYVAVFDESGYLYEYKQATATGVSSNGIAGAKSFSVDLKVVKGKARTIHFIANAPASVEYGSEEEVVASMVAYANPTDGQLGPDAYWQRVELPQGICYEPGTETTTRQLNSDTASKIANVGLIRNFAMFTVQVEATGYEFVEAILVNTPDRCYVAPYNRTTSKFQSDYSDKSAAELVEAGYKGSLPPTATIVKDFTNVKTPDASGAATFFLLEREKPVSNPTCVIVGAKKSGVTSYYKINLVTEDGSYYPILRNFNYEVVLANVFKDGYSTIEEAYNSAGSGDISTNVEYEDLTSVSNGESFLSVEYTDKVVINGNDFTLDYKFVPDLTDKYSSGEAKVANGVVSTKVDGVIIKLGEPGSLGAAIASYSVASSDNGDHTRTINIVPTAPSAMPKSQDITIIGQHVTEKGGVQVVTTIQRKVTIVVRGLYNMELSCTPNLVDAKVGEPVTLNIKLPQGLPSAIFPLDLAIEGENLSLSPLDGDISVVTGASIIPGSTKPSAFHFIKTINFSEYYTGGSYNLTFPVKFKTNTVDSATDIYVANEYFNTAKVGFYNPSKFTNLEFSEVGTDNSVSFSFKMATTDPVTVTLVGLAPATGSGLVDNGDGTYTYTPAAAGDQTLALMWTGAATFNVTISSEMYPEASLTGGMISVEFASPWYTGTPKQYTSTTVKARVLTTDADNTVVSFVVGGKTYTATKGSLVDGYYEYTANVTPQTAGNLEVTVRAVCGTQSSTATATMTVEESIFSVDFPTNWYTKASQTSQSAAAQDVATIVTVHVMTDDLANTKVSIKLGDQDAKTATMQTGNATDGYNFSATFTPSTYGTIPVTATATLSTATATATENMIVWKKVTTAASAAIGSSPVTSVNTSDTYVLKNLSTKQYLYASGNNIKVKDAWDSTSYFTFGTNNLYSVNTSKYVKIANGASLNNNSQTVTRSYSTSYKGFSLKGDTKYLGASSNGSLSTGNNANDSKFYWAVYKVTITPESTTWVDPTAQTNSESFSGEAGTY